MFPRLGTRLGWQGWQGGGDESNGMNGFHVWLHCLGRIPGREGGLACQDGENRKHVPHERRIWMLAAPRQGESLV